MIQVASSPPLSMLTFHPDKELVKAHTSQSS